MPLYTFMDSFQMKLDCVINNMARELSFLSSACFCANYSIKDWLALLLQSFSVRHDLGLLNSTRISESNLCKSWPIQQD